ncbi:MAG: N-acetylmuramoyl-L-alanine amidase [Candidatus Zixiibacteriota bacterium]
MKKLYIAPKIIRSFLSCLGIFVICTPLTFSTSNVNILSLQATEKVNGVLVEIFLVQPLKFEVFSDQSQTVNVNFFQGRLDTGYFNMMKSPDQLTWIKAYQFENSAQISFKPRKPFVNYTHNVMADSTRIQISLIGEAPIIDSVESSPADSSPRLEGFLDVSIERIVIDPGHGGEDSGAVGKKGLIEKKVTLDIANRLKKLLVDEKGFAVILTRDNDELVPLERRAEIANQNKADLFISIHTNASKKRSARGFETYFLSAAKNEEARTAAALENSSLRFEQTSDSSQNLPDIDFILMDLVQNEFLAESSDLATMIQKRLKKELTIPDRGVNQAGFVVLNKTYMPAVLVETAFISNQEDEALLKKDSFRQRVAQAIFKSIKEFKQKYESLK